MRACSLGRAATVGEPSKALLGQAIQRTVSFRQLGVRSAFPFGYLLLRSILLSPRINHAKTCLA